MPKTNQPMGMDHHFYGHAVQLAGADELMSNGSGSIETNIERNESKFIPSPMLEGGSGKGNNGGMPPTHPMMMYFHSGFDETIWFKFWQTTNANEIFIASLCVVFVCFLAEFIRWQHLLFRKRQIQQMEQARQELEQQQKRKSMDYLDTRKMSMISVIPGMCYHNGNGNGSSAGSRSSEEREPPTPMGKLADALLHGGELTLNYLLMLTFMTCNLWLCAAAVGGKVSARFVCSLLLSDDENEDKTPSTCS